LIVGFQVAARLAVAEREERAATMRARTDLAIKLLTELIPDIRLNTPKVDRAPHIVNVSFLDAENLDGEGILQAMDMRGVAVSNGSACVSGSLQPSHVLKAMGRSDAESKAAVRFSVSPSTTEKEILEAVTILSDVCRDMRVTTHI
jgi:cysteine desulfurase